MEYKMSSKVINGGGVALLNGTGIVWRRIATTQWDMVFWYQNCSDLLQEKLFLVCLRSLEQFIQTVKGQNNFWEQNAFLTCFMRFLISNKLEWLESKLEKKFWDRETCRKSEKIFDRDYFSDKINFILYPSVAKLKISTAQ